MSEKIRLGDEILLKRTSPYTNKKGVTYNVIGKRGVIVGDYGNYYSVILEGLKNSSTRDGSFSFSEDVFEVTKRYAFRIKDVVVATNCDRPLMLRIKNIEMEEKLFFCNGGEEGSFFIAEEDIELYYESAIEFAKKTMWGNEVKNISMFSTPLIKGVYFNEKEGCTVVKFSDGEIEKVTVQKGDKFDRQKGVLLCVAKKYFGMKSGYNDVLKACVENALETNKKRRK